MFEIPPGTAVLRYVIFVHDGCSLVFLVYTESCVSVLKLSKFMTCSKIMADPGMKVFNSLLRYPRYWSLETITVLNLTTTTLQPSFHRGSSRDMSIPPLS